MVSGQYAGGKNDMQKVLITGADGMLGKDLCAILEKHGYFTIKTDKNNMDILDPKLIERVVLNEKPDFVIHCAAYTNVDKAEDEPDKAMSINAKGTENVAICCGKNDIPIIYISTDYVFDGNKQTPYEPTDKPNPLNVYGKTKLAGEAAIQKFCKKFYIVRTSWLYGIHGKNFVETMKKLSSKNELKVVNDQKGCPTWTKDLCAGLITFLKGKPCGIYHICGSGETTWYEFAKEIFKQCGLSVNVTPCNSDEYKTKAIRPKYSAMNNNGFCRDWKEALSEYLKSTKDAEVLL